MTSPYLHRPVRTPEQVIAELQAEITTKDHEITELRAALHEANLSAGVAGEKIAALVVALDDIKTLARLIIGPFDDEATANIAKAIPDMVGRAIKAARP